VQGGETTAAPSRSRQSLRDGSFASKAHSFACRMTKRTDRARWLDPRAVRADGSIWPLEPGEGGRRLPPPAPGVDLRGGRHADPFTVTERQFLRRVFQRLEAEGAGLGAPIYTTPLSRARLPLPLETLIERQLARWKGEGGRRVALLTPSGRAGVRAWFARQLSNDALCFPGLYRAEGLAHLVPERAPLTLGDRV
jgi:hypothetical protein